MLNNKEFWHFDVNHGMIRLVTISLFFLTIAAKAQKSVISDGQNVLWMRYHLTLRFSDKTFWVNEADNRVFFRNFSQTQFITHSHLHYVLTPALEASIGVSYSRTKANSPDQENALGVPEIRPFQEFFIRQNLSKKWNIQHRFRLEERFFHNNNGVELTPGHNFNWRYRYQFNIFYTINDQFLIRANDEIFINSGKNIVYNTFDTNRIYIALVANFNKNLSAELGYLKSHQQLKNGLDYLDRDIVRFTFYQRLKLGKS